MNLAGTRTTCASRMLETYESPYTATCVQRMLDAGCVPVGKANMDEFAFGSSTDTSAFHPTNNPWNTACVPGGSSGGSAASVVSRYGVVAFGSSLDQVGPFGRTVEDVALAMDALVAGGSDPFDSTAQEVPAVFAEHVGASIAGKRVGIIPAFMEAEGLTAEVRHAVEEAARALEAAGAELVDVDLPHLDAAIAAYYVIGPAEAFSNLARFDGVRYGYQEPGCATLAAQSSLSRAHGFGAEAKRRQMLGAYLLSSGIYDKYYYAAQKARTLITEDYARAYEQVDVILMPAAPRTAFKHGEISDPTQMYLSDMYTISINIAGNGGMTVPLGVGEESGLPVAAQLVAPAFKDERLIAFGSALERAVAATPGAWAAGVADAEHDGRLGAPCAPAFAGKGGELA